MMLQITYQNIQLYALFAPVQPAGQTTRWLDGLMPSALETDNAHHKRSLHDYIYRSTRYGESVEKKQ
jgi:hypothetical protein